MLEYRMEAYHDYNRVDVLSDLLSINFNDTSILYYIFESREFFDYPQYQIYAFDYDKEPE